MISSQIIAETAFESVTVYPPSSPTHESETKYRQLIEQIPAVTYIAELAEPYAMRYISPQVHNLLGYALEEWERDPALWSRLVHAQDRARVFAALRASLTTAQPLTLEYRLMARDGRAVWVRDQAVIALDQARDSQVRQGMLLDITDHKQVEALIERNARELSALSQVGQTVLSSLDLDVVLNQVVDQIFPLLEGAEGLSILLCRDDALEFAAVRGPSAQVLKGNRIPANVGVAGKVFESGKSLRLTDANTALIHRDIERLTAYHTQDLLAVPLKVGNTVIGVIEAVHSRSGIFTDEHLRLLEAAGNWAAIAIENARLFNQVETAKKEWEVTIDALGEGIALVDDKCRILRVNRTLAEWLGTMPQQLVGRFCYEAIDGNTAPAAPCPHAQAMQAHEHKQQMEMEHARLGRTILFTTYPLHSPDRTFIGAVNVLQDVTAERQLQAQLIQSEKLAATGRLAASIAHEINNPLQAIQGCIDLAESSMRDVAKQQRYLTMAKTELNRLATVVRRMLDFYRTSKGTRGKFDLRALTEDVIALNARRLHQASVEIQTEWNANLPLVNVVGDQIQQVVLNLLLNAIEAMPNGGNLRVHGGMSAQNKGWVTVTFSDSGAGIAQEKLDKIFDPFYTTKPNGTGLGLSISHNIIKNHNGRLLVESQVGKGSAFTLWLPAE